MRAVITCVYAPSSHACVLVYMCIRRQGISIRICMCVYPRAHVCCHIDVSLQPRSCIHPSMLAGLFTYLFTYLLTYLLTYLPTHT